MTTVVVKTVLSGYLLPSNASVRSIYCATPEAKEAFTQRGARGFVHFDPLGVKQQTLILARRRAVHNLSCTIDCDLTGHEAPIIRLRKKLVPIRRQALDLFLGPQ